MCCWLRFGYMTSDVTNVLINAVNVVLFAGYLSAFAYYQPKRQPLLIQLSAMLVALIAIFRHVDQQPSESANESMAAIAAFTQIIGLAGGLYEIKRVISLGTTEFVDAHFQYGLFLLLAQWMLFALVTHNYYMAAANAAGLVVSVVTIALYFVYPPKTWRVPLIGTGPRLERKEKKGQ